jgi:hypothetical protein
MVALAILCLAGWGLSLAAPGAPGPAAKIQIETDRLVGLAPMSLEVSAVVEDLPEGTPALEEGLRVVLEVESAFVRMSTRDQEFAVVSSGSAGFEATVAHRDPLKRNLRLQRPGTYTFRWLIEDAQGNRALSNAVQVKVL